MKILILLLSALISFFTFSSNEKSLKLNNTSPKDSNSLSRTELLTSKPWIYEEYIRDFSSPSGQQVFKRNRKKNEFDLTQNVVSFHADGTFEELNENGENLHGTWKFIENETKLETIIPGTYYHNISVIKLLTADKLEWYDEEWDTYGEEIHQDVNSIDPKFL